MGVASSNLPTLAKLGIVVFNYPLVATLWYNNKTQSGWAISCTYTFFTLMLVVGFNIGDPLVSLIPPIPLDLTPFKEGVYIYFGVYAVSIFLSALLGWFISWIMDIREAFPFYAILPSYRTHNIENVVSTPCNSVDIGALKDYYCMCEGRERDRWCFTNIPRPYWHTLVGFLLSLLILTVPTLLFTYLFSVNKWAAYFTPMPLKVIGYIAAWLYWSYRTDLSVWGPTDYNTKERRASVLKDRDNSPFADDPNIDAFADALFAETQSLINKNVLVIGCTDILSYALLGAVIVIPDEADVDAVWITGITFIVIVTLIFAILTLYYYTHNGLQPLCPSKCPRLLNQSKKQQQLSKPFKQLNSNTNNNDKRTTPSIKSKSNQVVYHHLIDMF